MDVLESGGRKSHTRKQTPWNHNESNGEMCALAGPKAPRTALTEDSDRERCIWTGRSGGQTNGRADYVNMCVRVGCACARTLKIIACNAIRGRL